MFDTVGTAFAENFQNPSPIVLKYILYRIKISIKMP